MLYARELKIVKRLFHNDFYRRFATYSIMALPNKYQNGSVDSTVKGVYRASPIKLMIYGNGR